MNESHDVQQGDPLGLGELPLIDPPNDGWAGVEAALLEDRRGHRKQRLLGGLAVAASLVAVISLVLLRTPGDREDYEASPSGTQVANAVTEEDSVFPPTESEATRTTVAELVTMSQLLEKRLRLLRDGTASMPAESVIYVTELEDLVARVDHELSVTPDSIDLWSQRVNLLLDLEALFQHQFESEYGRMASL